MVDMIRTLIEKGYAYEKNGTVYYRTRKFKDYGKLSHKNLDDLQSGGRTLLVTGEDEKEDPLDFVLWKPKKEGEPAWSLRGARDVRDGISSVRRCPKNIWASRSTSMPAARI